MVTHNLVSCDYLPSASANSLINGMGFVVIHHFTISPFKSHLIQIISPLYPKKKQLHTEYFKITQRLKQRLKERLKERLKHISKTGHVRGREDASRGREVEGSRERLERGREVERSRGREVEGSREVGERSRGREVERSRGREVDLSRPLSTSPSLSLAIDYRV